MDKYINNYLKTIGQHKTIDEIKDIFRKEILENVKIDINIREILKLSITLNQNIYAAINILILNIEPFYKDYLIRNISNLKDSDIVNLHSMFQIKNEINDTRIVSTIYSQLYSTNVRTKVSHGKIEENYYNIDNYKRLLVLYLYIQSIMKEKDKNNKYKCKRSKEIKNYSIEKINEIYKDIFYLHLEECLDKQSLPNILLFSHLQTEKTFTNLLLEWISNIDIEKKQVLNKLILQSFSQHMSQFKYLVQALNLFKEEKYIECLYVLVPLLETITTNYIHKKINYSLKNVSLRKYINELNNLDYEKKFNREFIDFTSYLLNNNLINIRHDLCHGRLPISELNKTNCVLSLCYIVLIPYYFDTKEKTIEYNGDIFDI